MKICRDYQSKRRLSVTNTILGLSNILVPRSGELVGHRRRRARCRLVLLQLRVQEYRRSRVPTQDHSVF